jgi:Flp pilus assembly protein TadB
VKHFPPAGLENSSAYWDRAEKALRRKIQDQCEALERADKRAFGGAHFVLCAALAVIAYTVVLLMAGPASGLVAFAVVAGLAYEQRSERKGRAELYRGNLVKLEDELEDVLDNKRRIAAADSW